MLRGMRLSTVLVIVVALLAACRQAAPGHPLPEGWRRLDGAAFAPDRGSGPVSVDAVVAGGSGQPWLATGSQLNPAAGLAPRAWISSDGVTWRQDRFRSTTLDGPHDGLVGMARRGAVAVAAGEYSSPLEGNLRPTMWRRSGNGPWRDIDAPRELFGGERGGGVIDVAVAPSGFVTVGGWTDSHNQASVGVWTSNGGTVWNRVDGVAALSPAAGEVIQANAIVGMPAGVVVVGNSYHPAITQGVSWWSPDGLIWTRVDIPGASRLDKVAVTRLGAMAVGLDGSGHPASWLTTTGRQWVSAGILPAPPDEAFVLTSLAGGGQLPLAAGLGAGRPHLWRYSQGQWAPSPLPGDLVGTPGITKLVVASTGATSILIADLPSGPSVWRFDGAL